MPQYAKNSQKEKQHTSDLQRTASDHVDGSNVSSLIGCGRVGGHQATDRGEPNLSIHKSQPSRVPVDHDQVADVLHPFSKSRRETRALLKPFWGSTGATGTNKTIHPKLSSCSAHLPTPSCPPSRFAFCVQIRLRPPAKLDKCPNAAGAQLPWAKACGGMVTG